MTKLQELLNEPESAAPVRIFLAGMALSGLVSREIEEYPGDYDVAAFLATEYADALLRKLAS